MHMNWKQVAHKFEPDGSSYEIYDIYIFDVSIDDWIRVLNRLKICSSRISFTIDGEVIEEIPGAEYIFSVYRDVTCAAMFDFECVSFGCCFFSPNEIEFNINCHQISSGDEFDALCKFMKTISELCSKKSYLTEDNSRDSIFACYDPTKDNFCWTSLRD